jgi:hypothetical protein
MGCIMLAEMNGLVRNICGLDKVKYREKAKRLFPVYEVGTMQEESIWYDKSEMLSYNKLFNFVLGPRGDGKSYDMKKWVIKDFKKTGAEAIIVRRYKEELHKFEKNYFNDIWHEFPNDELKTEGGKILINGKIAGYFVPLSTSTKERSVAYPNVNKIIFEEFVIDKGAVRYLPGGKEVDTFLDFYETVARMRDNVRAVFVANSISVINPYFLFWNIKIDPKKRFTVKDHVVVELIKNNAYTRAKQDTRFGQMMKDTHWGKYAFEGEFLRDDSTFVEKKTPESKFAYGVKYNGCVYGFWYDFKAGLVFVSKQFDPSHPAIFSLTKDDHEPNLMLIQSLRDSRQMKKMVEAFQLGFMRFEDMQVKNQFFEYVRYFIR